ncbi:MAG: TolC family protein [Vicinamibacterales bacterium]
MPSHATRAAIVLCALAVPASAQPPALTLADALAAARASAPELAAAAARAGAADAASERAGRFLNPLAELRAENWPADAPGGLPLDVFVTLTQPFELGGKRDARRATAAAAAAAAGAGRALAWRAVATAVTADYLAALRAREHARALGAHADSLSESVRVVGRRVEVGTAPESELLKLRTEEARAAVDRARAELAAARGAATLGARIGRDVPLDQLQSVPLPPLPPGSTAVNPAHPELALSTSAVAVARAALDLEQARRLPDVGVTAGYKRTAGFNTGLAAITVPVPLFDRNGVARALADGQHRAAALDRDATERRLRGLMAATRPVAEALAGRAATARASLVEPARAARDAARAAFAAGALDVLRLVDAERVFIDASLAAIDLEIDAVAAAIEARLAAGEEPLP